MSKLDNMISDICYLKECLKTLADIFDTGNCNLCENKRTCEYVPEPGQMVRYNCPFYQEKVDKRVTQD